MWANSKQTLRKNSAQVESIDDELEIENASKILLGRVPGELQDVQDRARIGLESILCTENRRYIKTIQKSRESQWKVAPGSSPSGPAEIPKSTQIRLEVDVEPKNERRVALLLPIFVAGTVFLDFEIDYGPTLA